MIEVKELEKISKSNINENYRFRNYLKGHADEKELDEQFRELHNKYFKNYDCSKCRNCCKKLGVSMTESELKKICDYYEYDESSLKNILKEKYGEYVASPCPFLLENNDCKIDKCLPHTCLEYPYTNQPERLWSLLGVVKNSEICPVVYEILEELKKKYNFR